jgi:catechol 2,3-dioxygenase-like lactoylglutathione lyase family enzyme
MTIRLDHTIVPAKDKRASAAFFAEIFGLSVTPGDGYFAQVQVNESLTMDFADEPEAWGGPGRPGARWSRNPFRERGGVEVPARDQRAAQAGHADLRRDDARGPLGRGERPARHPSSLDNLISSRHPDDMPHFTDAIRAWLVRKECVR